jgi:NAD(P)-dependent dehydrogenase (short-subunit alcohol dehydrogenase family)
MKVVVIAGAASGIGRGLVERRVREGMKVVLADVEQAALAHPEQEFEDAGARVLAVRRDLSKADDVGVGVKALSAGLRDEAKLEAA